MRGIPKITLHSARTSRLVARLPRILLMVTLGVLTLAGLRVILFGAGAKSTAVAPAAARADLAMEGFAEAFTRAYLTYDARDPAGHGVAVRGFVTQSLGADAGFSPPGRGRQKVTWTAAVATEPAAAGQLITVAAELSPGGEVTYLAVPVKRTSQGVMAVYAYPALVGPPPADPSMNPPAQMPLSDAELETVARRALQNYLIGDIQNLSADLDAQVVVTLPSHPVRGFVIDHVYWAANGVVGLEGVAPAGGGGQMHLRYELGVVHKDRWFVNAVHLTHLPQNPFTTPQS